MKNNLHIKHLSDIECVTTSHGCGEKRVLIGKDKTDTDITQIAVTRLEAGECVDEHTHRTMEEMFLILSGSVEFTSDGEKTVCVKDDFIHIEVGIPHGLRALADTTLLTIGCAVKEKDKKTILQLNYK